MIAVSELKETVGIPRAIRASEDLLPYLVPPRTKPGREFGNCDTVGPGAPRFAFTFFQAASRLDRSTTRSMRDSLNSLKAGCSVRAATVDPGRENDPVVCGPSQSGKYRSACSQGFPRCELTDGSPLFFIVSSFPFRLGFEGR